MSLVRLLTTGKSLTGVDPATNRYRMRSRFLLPKFGSDKNPFTQPAAVPRAAVQETTPAQIAAANLKETRRLPATVAVELKTSGDQPVSGTFGRIREWLRRRNPLARWPRRNREPKAAIPRFNKSPIQVELSLDSVKVVRNDLNDADLEIVAAKPSAKPKSGPAAPVVEKAGLVEVRST